MRARAASPRSRSWAASTSRIWAPMVNTGLNAVDGFWKIIAMAAPRRRPHRRARRARAGRDPRSAAHPRSAARCRGSRRIAARPVTVLPQPVSPTTPTASPGAIARSTPRSATVVRSSPANARRRPRTSSVSGAATEAAAPAAAALPTGALTGPASGPARAAARRPTRLKASTVTKIARPGNVATHHWSRITVRPSATMRPQSGVGGRAPRPMNASEPAARIDRARCRRSPGR